MHTVRETVQAIAAEHDTLTITELAEKTVAELTDYHAAVTEMMPVFAREVLAVSRTYGTTTATSDTAATAPKPSGSFKVRQVREAWRERLEDLYSVDRAGTYKRLGDMTAAELAQVADAAAAQAASIARKAETWRVLAEKMTDLGAARLRDLPEGVLEEKLGGAR